MANRKMYRLTCGRRLLLAGAAVLALTMPVVVGLVDVSQVRAQSAENPRFEAASVKLHAGGTDRNTFGAGRCSRAEGLFPDFRWRF